MVERTKDELQECVNASSSLMNLHERRRRVRNRSLPLRPSYVNRKAGSRLAIAHLQFRTTRACLRSIILTPLSVLSGNWFQGPNAWYLNDASNSAFAAETPEFEQIKLPVLFLHALHDTVCDTVGSELAAPMRADCVNLFETTIKAGHALMLEEPDLVNATIQNWWDRL